MSTLADVLVTIPIDEYNDILAGREPTVVCKGPSGISGLNRQASISSFTAFVNIGKPCVLM